MKRVGQDGTDHTFAVQYFPLENQQGDLRGAVTTIQEITELKRRAQSLRESWETYRDLLKGIPHPIILHEMDGSILEVNEAASQFFGCTDQQCTQKNIRSFLEGVNSDRPLERLEQGVSDEEYFETECKTTENNRIPIDVAATKVDYFGTEAILTLARDISEQKAYQRELERTNAGLEEFAAVVSQDLRNPLTVAKGWTDIAREKQSIEPLRQVAASLERMNHVIDYTLTLARKGEGLNHLSKINLGNLVPNCWSAVETGNASLQNDLDLTTRCDRGRVSHLFETLFENCTNFDGPDGRFRVANLAARTGFFVEHDATPLPDDTDEVKSVHIGGDNSVDCDFVVVERIANAHGWRMRLVNGKPQGIRIEFSGVDRHENE